MVWWEVLTQTAAYPQFLATAGMLALAAALLYIDFNNAANRAFALLLVFRAMVMASATLNGLYAFSPPSALGGIGDAQAAAFWAAITPYFVIPLPFLIIWFASVYPRRRTVIGTTWWGPAALILIIVALEIAYAVDHSLYYSTFQQQLTTTDGQWVATMYSFNGPFAILLGAMYLGLGLLGLLFAFDHSRLPAGPRKNGIFLVAVAFVVNALFDASVTFFSLLMDFSFFVGSVTTLLLLGAAVPALLALLLFGRSYRDARPAEKRRLHHTLVLAVAAIVSGLLAALPAFGFIQIILTGFWRLWLPALVTYALVRHQLFDIDLKIKFALTQSTLAGLAFVGFVVMSETLEAIITSSSVLTDAIPERWTDLASLGVAVSLTYALNPVKHFAAHVANRAMPNTENTEEYLARKRLEVFRATLEGAVEDGQMTEREQRLVERLRAQLGLSEEDTAPIMAEVEAAYEGRTIGAPSQGTAVP